jgi:hypothetical protein
MKIAIVAALAAVLAGLGLAQQQVQLTAVPPPAVQGVQVGVIGTPGMQTYCYWLVANYVAGSIVVPRPSCLANAPNALSSGNNVQITWSPVAVVPPGTVNYTILRTVNITTRPNPGDSIVVRNLAATTWNDIGSALTTWTPTPVNYPTASDTIYLDNVNHNPPRVVFSNWPINLAAPNDLVGFSTNVTLAQVNAGVTIVAPVSTRTLRVSHFLLQALGGNTAGCTSVNISDTGNPIVDVAAVAVAGLTQNTVVTEATASTVTLGTFATGQLTAGAGLQVRQVGSACTTATSFNVTVFYQINF